MDALVNTSTRLSVVALDFTTKYMYIYIYTHSSLLQEGVDSLQCKIQCLDEEAAAFVMDEEVIVPVTSIQLLVQPPAVIQHKTTRCPLSPEVCIY